MPTVSIQWNDSEQTFELTQGELLYQGLKQRGLDLPHGCLAGACSACKVEVLAGAENLDQPGVVEQNTLDAVCQKNPAMTNKTIRLSCRARVFGSVKITPLGSRQK